MVLRTIIFTQNWTCFSGQTFYPRINDSWQEEVLFDCSNGSLVGSFNESLSFAEFKCENEEICKGINISEAIINFQETTNVSIVWNKNIRTKEYSITCSEEGDSQIIFTYFLIHWTILGMYFHQAIESGFYFRDLEFRCNEHIGWIIPRFYFPVKSKYLIQYSMSTSNQTWPSWLQPPVMWWVQ